MINEQQFVLFFTAKQNQCMQVLLQRTAAYSAVSNSKATKINQEIG